MCAIKKMPVGGARMRPRAAMSRPYGLSENNTPKRVSYYTAFHTLKRNRIISPSCTTYSLPSLLTRPFSFAAAMEPQAIRSS